LSGSGTPFVINGTFNYQTSTFKYIANADTYITAADYWNLELKPANTAPDAPTNPSPANGSTSVATSTILSVDVYDTDGDAMTISFYNASTSALIGTTSIAASQSSSTATTTWSSLSTNTTYQWATATSTGNLGGRSGADTFCTDNKQSNLPAGATNIHAFLGVTSTDEIRDMPDVYGYTSTTPIYWWHNTNQTYNQLASDWADMLDSSIALSQDDGTGDTLTILAHTGCTNYGVLQEFTCTGCMKLMYFLGSSCPRIDPCN